MSHRKHIEAFAKRGQGEGCTTDHFWGRAWTADQRLSDCHAARAPFGWQQTVVSRPSGGLVLADKGSHGLLPMPRRKAEHEGKVVSRTCETCHLPEKISKALLFD